MSFQGVASSGLSHRCTLFGKVVVHSDRETVSRITALLVKIPDYKWLKYRVFYTAVGFDTAAAANPT